MNLVNPYTFAGLSNRTITSQLVFLSKSKNKLVIDNITDSSIIILNNYFGTNVVRSDIFAKTRRREVVQIRQCIMYHAKERTRMSLKDIGMYLGGRDHSTVIHGVRTWGDMISYDKEFIRVNSMVLDKLDWLIDDN